MSGSTAEPAAGESTDKPGKNETWIEKSFLGGAESDAKDDAPEQGDVEAGKDGKSIAAKKDQQQVPQARQIDPKRFPTRSQV